MNCSGNKFNLSFSVKPKVVISIALKGKWVKGLNICEEIAVIKRADVNHCYMACIHFYCKGGCTNVELNAEVFYHYAIDSWMKLIVIAN